MMDITVCAHGNGMIMLFACATHLKSDSVRRLTHQDYNSRLFLDQMYGDYPRQCLLVPGKELSTRYVYREVPHNGSLRMDVKFSSTSKEHIQKPFLPAHLCNADHGGAAQ